MVMDLQEKAAAFRALHVPRSPLVLFNAWDAGSATTVAKSGAAAIATGSWSIAAANGLPDGEKVDRSLHLQVIGSIASVVDLPLTADLESGFSEQPEGVGETVTLAIDRGAIGCNLEDSYPANGSLRPIDDATARYRFARRAANDALPGFFLNARTDVFFQNPPEEHSRAMVEEALERGRAYADAGADGLFVPFVSDLGLIRELASRSPLPLNIMRMATTPSIADLADAGVARVSHGPLPYILAMGALEAAARENR
jgi:2-methylisocitrate lyase-like PEP mutase family enzyme